METVKSEELNDKSEKTDLPLTSEAGQSTGFSFIKL
jgi:hypothetical protein